MTMRPVLTISFGLVIVIMTKPARYSHLWGV